MDKLKESYSFLFKASDVDLVEYEIYNKFKISTIEFVSLIMEHVNNVISEKKVHKHIIEDMVCILNNIEIKENDALLIDHFINNSYDLLSNIQSLNTNPRYKSKDCNLEEIFDTTVNVIINIYNNGDLLMRQFFIQKLINNENKNLIINYIMKKIFENLNNENENYIVFENILIDIIGIKNSSINRKIESIIIDKKDQCLAKIKRKLIEAKNHHKVNINASTICNSEVTYKETNPLIITIDNNDTKDRDDAFSLRKLSNKNYLLTIYITNPNNINLQRNKISDVILDEKYKLFDPKENSLTENSNRNVIAYYFEINNIGIIERVKVEREVIKVSKNISYSENNLEPEIKTLLSNAKRVANLINYNKNIHVSNRDLIINNFMTLTNNIVATIFVDQNKLFLYKNTCNHKGEFIKNHINTRISEMESRLSISPEWFYLKPNQRVRYTKLTNPLLDSETRLIQLLSIINFEKIELTNKELYEISNYLKTIENKGVQSFKRKCKK